MSIVDGPAWEKEFPSQPKEDESFQTSEQLAAYVKGLENTVELLRTEVLKKDMQLDDHRAAFKEVLKDKERYASIAVAMGNIAKKRR